MRPSDRIRELVQCGEWSKPRTDGEFIEAILAYLDENPPPVYTIQPLPLQPNNQRVITTDNTRAPDEAQP